MVRLAIIQISILLFSQWAFCTETKEEWLKSSYSTCHTHDADTRFSCYRPLISKEAEYPLSLMKQACLQTFKGTHRSQEICLDQGFEYLSTHPYPWTEENKEFNRLGLIYALCTAPKPEFEHIWYNLKKECFSDLVDKETANKMESCTRHENLEYAKKHPIRNALTYPFKESDDRDASYIKACYDDYIKSEQEKLIPVVGHVKSNLPSTKDHR